METNTPKKKGLSTADTSKPQEDKKSFKTYAEIKGLKHLNDRVGQAFVMHLKKQLSGMKISSDKKES